MSQYTPLEGTVTSISNMWTSAGDRSGCTLMFALLTDNRETINIVVSPDTYVLDQEPIRRGDRITVFYDTMAPVPLIYPPQYRAAALLKTAFRQYAMLDYFDRGLLNSDQTLQLMPSSATVTQLANGQNFIGTVGDQFMLVLYGATTRSIPAQTTPDRIIVFCSPDRN